MKAAQLIKYDKKDPLIEIRDVNSQPLGAHDLLIRTKTAAVNPLDNLISHGDLKLVVPYKLPQTMGNEFVGIIEKIGPKVTNFKIGDRIFARNPVNNAFAQKIVINEKAVAKAPEYLSDQEAAAVPLTTLTAMQAFQLLNLKAGQTLFISGGSGSFGAMAIPLAIGLFVGGYLGQKSIKYMSPTLVRWITAALSLVLAGYLFYTAYLQ